MRACLRADAERVSYSQQAALGKIIIFFVTNWFYFSFLHCPKLIARKQSTCTPTAPPAGCASYLVSTSSSPHVFGWLLCIFLSFGGRRRICRNRRGCCRPRHTLCRHLCCPRCCHHTPLMSLHGCAAYPILPLSLPRVFGWLSREKNRTACRGCLRPRRTRCCHLHCPHHCHRAPQTFLHGCAAYAIPLRHASVFLVGCCV
jgi:hypothetical protein